MTDRYQQFAASPAGRAVVKRLGLPDPVPLRRYAPGQPIVSGPVLIGEAAGGRLSKEVDRILRSVGAEVLDAPREGTRLSAIVFDASGITDSDRLRELYTFLHPVVRGFATCGRLIVLGTPPEDCDDAREAVAQRALEGFVKSVGKEVKRGTTAQLVYVSPGAEPGVESTLRFLLSARSAYVSGQVVRVGRGEPAIPDDWERPLDGQVALVTGAAMGIGAVIAEVLARDGAQVVCLDIPAQGDRLAAVANRVGGSTVQLDITAPDAPRALGDHLRERYGGVDVVVHNAGVTRDKTLARMSGEQWDAVLGINLSAQQRLDDVLLGEDALRPGGRVVCVSSINGIAGQRGQTNYATSKAGIIGRVKALAPTIARRPGAINAVAPGFIETRLTDAMPIGVREAGRRLNSMAQGGLPGDVAEAVAWLASPASAGVNGSVVRVCGQSLLGA
ncbi:MAG: 3-oxoacyl-ACP reductase [Streptosporangiaceae bacterium]